MVRLDDRILRILQEEGMLKIKDLKIKLDSQGYNDISYSTIDSSILRLAKKGYIIWEKYKPVKLAQSGVDRALELKRHAQLLELFLFSELNMSVEEAHEESEKFALLFSCNTINKICEKYDHPKECPCGEEILNSDDCYCSKKTDSIKYSL